MLERKSERAYTEELTCVISNTVKLATSDKLNATKKWSFKRGGLLSEIYLTISNRTTAYENESPVACRSFVEEFLSQISLNLPGVWN